KPDSIWPVTWIAISVLLIGLVVWLRNVTIKILARTAFNRKTVDEVSRAWATCVGSVRSTLETAKDSSWKAVWVADKLYHHTHAAHATLSRALETNPSRRTKSAVTIKLRVLSKLN